MITRRWFIGGLVSSGALGAHRLLAVPPKTFLDAKPNLRMGVVSDVHVRLGRKGVGFAAGYGTETLKAAFEYFRDQRIDVVVLPGDMADSGLWCELQAVADTWFSVFPEDRRPDGGKVERVFTLGNHDWNGNKYGKQVFAEEDVRRREAICNDGARRWREAFHEDFAPAYLKQVNGYPFFGVNWVNDGQCVHFNEHGCDVFKDFFAANVGKTDPHRPFSFVQHPHPKDTCYGPWAWGHDNGAATKALTPYANAIALSGHSHYPLTDERSIWQGAFTSVGCGSLRCPGMPSAEFPEGFENTQVRKGSGRFELDASKMMRASHVSDCRYGMTVDVWDDRVVFARREFVSGVALGPDWLLPFGGGERPFDFARQRTNKRAPEFPAAAVLQIVRGKAKTRGKGAVKPETKEAYTLTIPCADAEKTARVVRYDVVAVGASERKTFRVGFEGAAYPPQNAKAHQPTAFRVSVERCPEGLSAFAVTPVSCWDRRGRTLRARV